MSIVYQLFEAYKAFMQRIPVVGHHFTLISEKPQAVGTSFFVVQPHFYRDICRWAAFFYFSSKIITFLIHCVASKKLESKDKEKVKVIDSYVAALLHHTITVAISGFQIFKDWRRTAEERAIVDYTPGNSLCIIINCGYFLEDIIFYVIPKRDRVYLAHHICFIVMSLSIIYTYNDAPSYFLKYVPYVTVSEISAIPFIIAWFLRLFDISTGQEICEKLFVVLFFFWRILSMPVALTSVLWANDKPKLFVAVCSYTGIILQFYWMYQIIASTLRRGKTRKNN